MKSHARELFVMHKIICMKDAAVMVNNNDTSIIPADGLSTKSANNQ